MGHGQHRLLERCEDAARTARDHAHASGCNSDRSNFLGRLQSLCSRTKPRWRSRISLPKLRQLLLRSKRESSLPTLLRCRRKGWSQRWRIQRVHQQRLGSCDHRDRSCSRALVWLALVAEESSTSSALWHSPKAQISTETSPRSVATGLYPRSAIVSEG